VSLEPATQQAWQDYLAAERDKVRPRSHAALDRFIDALLVAPAAEWHAWARALSAQVADDGAEVPVRFPLFRRVVLPALAAGVRDRLPGCARWLAHFEGMLLNVPDAGLPPELRTAVGLYQEALRQDPGDRLSRERLVARWARYLEYTLHELPLGVLFGRDAATPEECRELQGLLHDFKVSVEHLGRSGHYAELISRCELHFASFHEWLVQGRPCGSYEQFREMNDSEMA